MALWWSWWVLPLLLAYGNAWTLGSIALEHEALHGNLGRLTFITEHGVRAKEHPAVVRNARIHVAIWVAVVVASLALWSPLPALLLLLPSWYGSTLFLLCGLTQHAGLTPDVRDHRRNTRSFTTNPLISFLYFGMQYHLEHHLYPQVPSYRLPELHAALRDQLPAPRRGLVGAWREVLPALRRRQEDPSWFVDVPVPDPVVTPRG